METKTCSVCGAPVTAPQQRVKCCSSFCSRTAANRSLSENGRRGLKWCRSCKRVMPFERFELRVRVCRECSDLRVAGKKRCTECGIVKDRATEFHTRRNVDGHEAQCRECSAERSRRYSAKPENLQRKRTQHYRWRYGITADEFDAMVAAQDGLCNICHRLPNGKGALHVDHDHTCCPGERTCGECRRGLICMSCNVALGAIRDDLTTALAMVKYLRRYSNESETSMGP